MNRREAIKALAMLPAVKVVDGEVATISPRNPQAFVITMPQAISKATIDALREQWEQLWKGSPLAKIPVIIMDGGAQLQIIDEVLE